MMNKKKQFFIFSCIINIIFSFILIGNTTSITGIEPNGIIITDITHTTTTNFSNPIITNEDELTITWWWWENLISYPPPTLHCVDFNVSLFQICIINYQYPFGINITIMHDVMFSTIPTSIDLNLSSYIIDRDNMVFGVFLGVWYEGNHDRNHPDLYQWVDIEWYPQSLEPRILIEIPYYVYIILPLLSIGIFGYYIYWKSSCKNTDNFTESKCVKERQDIQQKQREVKQQQQIVSQKLFGESSNV